jgi:hypothetical protein
MTDVPALRRTTVAMLALALLGAAGSAAAGDNVSVSGSVYVDEWWIRDRAVAARSPEGITPEASLKVQVEIHDDLSFSTKACFSCHGVELDHVYLDWTPKSAFNVQAGRLTIPFGEYSNRIDPSGHRTASAPLIYDMGRMAYGEKTAMNLGIVPLPYVDTGVLVYGTFWLGRIQTWYGLYGVAGFRGTNGVDWTAMRSGYTDNNREPGVGGRLAFTWSNDPGGFFGDLSVGASFTGSRYDRDAKLKSVAAGLDASAQLGPFTVRGEWAASRTDLDPTAAGYRYVVVDPFFQKEGWYAELEHPLGSRLQAVYRYDELHRTGVPLPSSSAQLTADSRIDRYTAGLVWTPVQGGYVKLGWEYWDTNDFAKFQSVHVGFGGAF